MSRYEKITATSKKLSILCLVSIISLPLYLAHHWLLPFDLWLDDMPFGVSLRFFDTWPPSAEKQFWGILICYLPGFFIAKSLWHLKQLFTLYSEGIFFSKENVALYNNAFSAALWFVIVWIISQSLLSAAMSYDSKFPVLDVTFTHVHALALFTATLMRLITWIMSVGQELAVENQSFV